MSNAVVSGLADYGRAKTYISSGIMVLISLVVVVIAIIMARSSAKDVHTTTVRATLKGVKCETTKSEIKDDKGGVRTFETVTCSAAADYGYNGTNYTAQGLTFPGPKSDGSVVDVFINPQNPNDVISAKPIPPVWGYAIASFAVLFAAGAIGYAYFMSKSETFAAVHGATEAAGDVRSFFRGGDGADVSWDSSFE